MSPSASTIVRTLPASESPDVLLRIVDTFVLWLLMYAAVMAWFAVPVLTVRSLAPESAFLPYAVGAAASVSMLLLAWTLRDSAGNAYAKVSRAVAGMSDRSWIGLCFAAGLLLRLAWVASFPSHPASDGATYVGLARKLIAGEPYAAGGTSAYWPPGYPLFLAPWLALMASERVAIILSNLTLFAASMLGVWALARRVVNGASARMALALFAVWPNLAFQAGMPEKEQLLVALFTWAIALAVWKHSTRPPLLKSLACGLLLGMATLVQPALQLIPFALLCYWFLCTRSPAVSLRMFAAAVLGMAIVIAPWTWRNYKTFDAFVLVSTNGGFGIYGANNERANGGYFETWPDDLMQMPELEADREAKRRAAAWIVANPARFLGLAFEKNIRFMGDDAVGVYQTLKRGNGSPSEVVYAAAKAGSNLFWLALWAVLAAGLFASWRARRYLAPGALIVPFAFLYFLLLHSIVESSGKYHVLTEGILSVLVPMILTSTRRPTAQVTGGPEALLEKSTRS